MEYRVIWTAPALEDLQAIGEYIGRDSRVYAGQFVLRLQEQTGRLSQFPHQGRVIPEFASSDYRELIIGSYRLFYTVRESTVYILTIVHGAKEIRQDG